MLYTSEHNTLSWFIYPFLKLCCNLINKDFFRLILMLIVTRKDQIHHFWKQYLSSLLSLCKIFFVTLLYSCNDLISHMWTPKKSKLIYQVESTYKNTIFKREKSYNNNWPSASFLVQIDILSLIWMHLCSFCKIKLYEGSLKPSSLFCDCNSIQWFL